MINRRIGHFLSVALVAMTLAAAGPAAAQLRQPDTPPSPWMRGLRLNVADLDRSVAFYQGLLGLKLFVVTGKGTKLEQAVFTPTGTFNYHQVLLVLSKNAALTRPIDPAAIGWVSVWVPSVDEATAKVRAAGYAVTTEPVDAPAEKLRRSIVKDPDGYEIEILNFVID